MALLTGVSASALLPQRAQAQSCVAPCYAQTAAELAASVTPTDTSYPPGNVRRYGAVGNGVANDTTALQNAHRANNNYSVFYPTGAYKITASITVYNQHVAGENKEHVFILPTGNFPAFINDQSQFINCQIKRLFIAYSETAPSDPVSDGLKVGIRFSGINCPARFDIEDIDVRGAWYAYFDDAGTYGSSLKRVFAWNCFGGFHKSNGTTIVFEACGTQGASRAWFLDNVIAPTLISCYADTANVTAGNFVCEIRGCFGVSIHGWDSEGCAISGDGAGLFGFIGCRGSVNGVVSLDTALAGPGNSFVFRITNSLIAMTAIRTSYNGLVYSGSGHVYAVLSETGSMVTIMASDIDAGTGGSPVSRYALAATGTATIRYSTSTTTGTISAGVSTF